jgi:predicted glycoside hydrolase/deacetylase ChbG (UPF0249 family)
MNPVLKALGYSDNDRVLIFHADDIGSSHASVEAYRDLLDFGLLSSAATMTPCSWFPAAAALCRERGNVVDMGVHLTLNCEYDVYRWSALSTTDAATGLFDSEGYLHRTTKATQTQATVDAVETEITAQIERAIAAGIDPTHIDTHMGAMFGENFMPLYYQAGQKYRLPHMVPRSSEQQLREFGFDDATINATRAMMQVMDEQRIPLFDALHMMSLDEAWSDPAAQVIAELEKVQPGLTYFIIHPVIDTPEVRALSSDWRSRVRDYGAFKSERLRDYVTNAGIKVIGYRKLRDWMRETTN